MKISAALVKELRERTGAGMMECKKALTENDGNIEVAIEEMRKSGQAKAAKKAGRIAAEGAIVIRQDDSCAAMVEVNCETDFVSKGDDFKDFCDAVANTVLTEKPADLEALLAVTLSGGEKTVEKSRQDLIAKIGENINVRRLTIINKSNNTVGIYLHGIRIGVLVDIQNGNPELAKDIAMHIAASKPVCISSDQVPADLVAKEKEIFTAQAADSGKPDNIIEKMVTGRLNKFLREITLMGQPFVKDPDKTVEKLLQEAGATITSFKRFEVGEGIEKKTDNFVDEVMQQVQK
ncbi:translation elongation factor Ts [Candidatus Halobeggiatoa sp. HSG11]|nr:translation elongation factor Ts [Candidatus Halobeggiatoa sp. HSG11]